jgi:hypothetical protein
MMAKSNRQDFLHRSYQWQRSRMLARRTGLGISLAVISLTILAVFLSESRQGEHPPSVVRADYVWVQMLPDHDGHGGRLARAIVTRGNHCPQVVESGMPLQMRAVPSRVHAAYPILLCERELAGDSEATIGAESLPIRPAEPHAIAVIGDTGCRVTHYAHQPCDSLWPFGQIAARMAEKLKPDEGHAIIVHVGDFHYREKPCLDDDRGCAKSPFGDNWETWKVEFFEPAKKLLLSAPWVILRGNHESCERAGAGWLFFFALPNQAYDGVCSEDMPSYYLNIGHTTAHHPRVLLVLDTANEGDKYALKKHKNDYPGLITYKADPESEVWLALHQPLWLLSPEDRKLQETTQKSTAATPTATECTDEEPSALDAIRKDLYEKPRLGDHRRFSLVLSGDTHLFQVFWPEDTDLPVQLIAGNGGTALDKLPCKAGTPLRADRSGVTSFKVDATPEVAGNATTINVAGNATAIARFGFTMLSLRDNEWTTATLIDISGKAVTKCSISAHGTCSPTPELQGALSTDTPSVDVPTPSGAKLPEGVWVQRKSSWKDPVTFFGFLGGLLVLVAYLLNLAISVHKWRNSIQHTIAESLIGGWKYPTLNLVGASLIIISLWNDWNAPSFVVELFWAISSLLSLCFGLIALGGSVTRSNRLRPRPTSDIILKWITRIRRQVA